MIFLPRGDSDFTKKRRSFNCWDSCVVGDWSWWQERQKSPSSTRKKLAQLLRGLTFSARWRTAARILQVASFEVHLIHTRCFPRAPGRRDGRPRRVRRRWLWRKHLKTFEHKQRFVVCRCLELGGRLIFPSWKKYVTRKVVTEVISWAPQVLSTKVLTPPNSFLLLVSMDENRPYFFLATGTPGWGDTTIQLLPASGRSAICIATDTAPRWMRVS